MIDKIWQLETVGSDPSDAATLDSLGIVAASLYRSQQAASELTLEFADTAAALDADELYAWETQLNLVRDGIVHYQGRVAVTPSVADGSAESRSITLRDVWWDLERTLYLQAWTSQSATGQTSVQTGRALFGYDPGTRARSTTTAALQTVLDYAVSLGITVTLDATRLAGGLMPPVRAHNATCADILRQIMHWEGDAVLVTQCDESTGAPTLRGLTRDQGGAVTIAATACQSLDIAARPDLVPDSVHVIYETTARTPEIVDGALQAPRTFVAATDVYPPASSITRKSMVVTLPGPDLGSGDDTPSTPPQPHLQPVQTRPMPENGAYDSAAERWWLDHSGFAALGITTAHVKLPTSSTADVIAHRVQFADDKVDDPPSAINPNATPVYRPPSVDDLPRELVSGSLAEWMNVEWSDVICDVTMALRKSAVDALPIEDRRVVLAMAPRIRTIQGIPSYLVDLQARVTATNAVTKAYKQWPATNPQGLTADNAGDAANEAAAAAAEQAIVPDLARRLYLARADTPYEGSLTLSAVDAGSRGYIGHSLNIYSPDRPAWSTMRAAIQGESVDLMTGETSLTFGPPEHLGPQDWLALHQAAFTAQESRGSHADSAPTNPGGNIDPDPEDEDEDEPQPGIFHPDKTPASQLAVRGAGKTRNFPWDLTVENDDPPTVTITPGTLLSGTADASDAIEITGGDSTFTVAAGGYIYLVIEAFAPTTAAVAYASSWPVTGSRLIATTTGGESELVFDKSYLPLYKFVAEVDADNETWTEQVAEEIYAQRLAPWGHLQLVNSWWADPDTDERIVVPTFRVAQGAL